MELLGQAVLAAVIGVFFVMFTPLHERLGRSNRDDVVFLGMVWVVAFVGVIAVQAGLIGVAADQP